MAGPGQSIESKEEKPLTSEEEKRVWSILHRNMASDDRYPGEVVAGPPYYGDQSAYCNAMRGCLNGPTPI